MRRRERKWLTTRLATDLIHLKEQRPRVCQMFDSAKAAFYHDKIAACGQDSKCLCRLILTIILGFGHETHLPKIMNMGSTIIDMVNAFNNDKVIKICVSLHEMAASGSFVEADSQILSKTSFVNFQAGNRRSSTSGYHEISAQIIHAGSDPDIFT